MMQTRRFALPSHPVTWGVSTALLVVLALLLSVLPSTPAAAQSPTWSVERFEGDAPSVTSVVAVRALWGDADTVVLARDDQFADALAAAPVAAGLNAPLLLTPQFELPEPVRLQLEFLRPQRVIVMGGSAAIGDSVIAQLRDALGVPDIQRLAGPNRFETAAVAARFLQATVGTQDPLVVRGEGAGSIGGWEDAMAASQHGALTRRPILLTRTTELPAETAAALRDLGAGAAGIVGGDAAVNAEAERQINEIVPTFRLAGPSRYDTSIAVADATLSEGADVSHVFLAAGDSWQDALVAGANAGARGGVLLYANPNRWEPSQARDWLLAHAGQVQRITTVGHRDTLPTAIDFDLHDLANPYATVGAGDAPIYIRPQDDAATIMAASPVGSTFLFTTGVHRGVMLRPRDGDTFVGEQGTVLSGAAQLPDPVARTGSGAWVIEGITHDPLPQIAPVEMDAGREAEALSADLFAGHERLRHVAGEASLVPGTWHFDTAGDRVLLHDDPATLGPLELSVTPYAFASQADRVTVRDLEIERYATGAKEGAIDAHVGHSWTIQHVTVAQSHGSGIRTGAGTVVRDSRLVHNGQIGISGSDVDLDRNQAPVTIEGNEIAYNGEVGFKWDWEAGGAKMTTTGQTVFRGNWAHHNKGVGLWCDVGCTDVTFAGNLVEHNAEGGILLEGSQRSDIVSNISRSNGAVAVGDLGAGIWISDSREVTVRENVMTANRLPIIGSHTDRYGVDNGIYDLTVVDNDIAVDAQLPGLRVTNDDLERYQAADIVFDGNRYRLRTTRDQHFWAGEAVGVADWQNRFGNDLNGTFASVDDPPQLSQSTPFAFRAVGH